MDHEPLLTVSNVAQTLAVSEMTVYRAIRQGELRAIRVGKNYRIRREDFDEYLSSREVTPTPGTGWQHRE